LKQSQIEVRKGAIHQLSFMTAVFICLIRKLFVQREGNEIHP